MVKNYVTEMDEKGKKGVQEGNAKKGDEENKGEGADGQSGDEDEGVKDDMFKRQKKGLFKEYYFFKDKILWVMFFLDIFSSFIEKTEKLIHWHNRKTSEQFLLVLLVVFIVVSFLPIRFFIVLACKFHSHLILHSVEKIQQRKDLL